MKNKLLLTKEDCDGLALIIENFIKYKNINDYKFINSKTYKDFKDFDRVFNTMPKGYSLNFPIGTDLLDFDTKKLIIDNFVLGTDLTNADIEKYRKFLKKSFKYVKTHNNSQLLQKRFSKDGKRLTFISIENLK